jgi:hypothetical protein
MEVSATGRQNHGCGTYVVPAKDGKIIEFHAHPNAAEMMVMLPDAENQF